MLSLRHMLLVCLLAPFLALNAQPRNPYDLSLQQVQADWASAGKLGKLVLLDRMLHLRDYVSDGAEIQRALENIRQSTPKIYWSRPKLLPALMICGPSACLQSRAHSIGMPNRRRASMFWLR